ncbi:MAG TPA: hypothetical protein DDY78_08885 [Planctomycetales bacterium]|jgi:hypothetical protein|nr:hypothetical protein [Planctomycetales bacterium]
MTKQQRLEEYYNRLQGQQPSTTAEQALDRLEQTLIEVEDDHSGIPRSDPPPPRNTTDGRLYPPLEDSIIRNPDGSISATTKGHNIEISSGGSITIRDRQTGQIDFHQPGGGL